MSRRDDPGGTGPLYGLYQARLRRQLQNATLPHHVAMIIDGNRRWARERALETTASGHRAGAEKMREFLGWCDEVGVEVVTLWLLSTDNLDRPPSEVIPLLRIIENAVTGLAATGTWRIHPVGALDLLPETTATVLKEAEDATCEVDGLLVNVAVGYGGRREVVDAVRALLAEESAHGASLDDVAARIDVDHIAEHLYTKGQPDPDLVIRTSGEQRLSGFLLWQSAHSEFYFCEAYWPDFRKVDFLRALRSYGSRERRFGR